MEFAGIEGVDKLTKNKA